jgi:hypothetical protein
VLIVPYQFTGSVWFIAGMLSLAAGQVILTRAARSLTRPLFEVPAAMLMAKPEASIKSILVQQRVVSPE